MCSFLKRLDVYIKLPPTNAMTEMIVKILVQLISTLAVTSGVRQWSIGTRPCPPRVWRGCDGSEQQRLDSTAFKVAVARTLLEHGADATARSEDGRTPLHNTSVVGQRIRGTHAHAS